MAKIKSYLGPVSGKLGEMVFRKRKTGNFIATRPNSFIPGTDTKSVNRRSRFGLTCKLADAINTTSILKRLWDINTPNTMSPFNGIVKFNYGYVTPSDVSSSASVVPGVGFVVPNPVFTKSSAQLKIDTDALGAGTEIDPAAETHIFCAGIVFLSDRKDPAYKLEEFLVISYPKIPTNLVSPLSFIHTMNDVQSQLFDRYNTAKAFFAIISLDADEKPVHFSNTMYSA